MCATFEVVVKVNELNEEKEKVIEKRFKNRGFLPQITTVQKLENQKKKDIEKMKQWEKQNPEEYQLFKVAYEEIDAEEYRLNYDHQHTNMILISCDSTEESCLCDIEGKQIHRLLNELLEEAEELYYDPSSDMYFHPKDIFWTTEKEISIANQDFDWKPSMNFRERVKITKY